MTLINTLRSFSILSSLLDHTTCPLLMFTFIGTIFKSRSMLILLLGFNNILLQGHCKFCTEKLDYTKNASQDWSNNLLDLVKQSCAFHPTINHPQLPIKANITLGLSQLPNLEIATLLAHTMGSSSLINSLIQKVFSLDKCISDLYKHLGELKCPPLSLAIGNLSNLLCNLLLNKCHIVVHLPISATIPQMTRLHHGTVPPNVPLILMRCVLIKVRPTLP